MASSSRRFSSRGQPFRVGVQGRHPVDERRRVGIVLPHGAAGPLAQQVHGTIGRDPVQPRAEPRAGFEPRQLGVRLQERVLDDVLGVLRVAGQPVGDAEDSSAVPLDERAKGLTVAGPGLGQHELLSVVHLMLGRKAGAGR
jgi:hypothetical protein